MPVRMKGSKTHLLQNGITILLLALILWCRPLSGMDRDASPAITHGPYLQNPSSTGMTIIWFTNTKCVSHVEFGEGGSLDHVARASRHGLFDAYNTRHEVRLEGLEPEKSLHRYPVLVGGRDTVIRADVSGKRVAITVFDADGRVIHTMSLD